MKINVDQALKIMKLSKNEANILYDDGLNVYYSDDAHIYCNKGKYKVLAKDFVASGKRVSNVEILNTLNESLKTKRTFSAEELKKIRVFASSTQLNLSPSKSKWRSITDFFSRLQNKARGFEFLTSQEMAREILRRIPEDDQNVDPQ